MKMRNRDGFVFPLTIVLLTCVSFVLFGVVGYCSFQARMARVTGETARLRFAAQSVIEEFKSIAVYQFARFCSQPSIHVSVSYNDVYQWFTGASGAGDPTIGATGYEVKMDKEHQIDNGRVCLSIRNITGDPRIVIIATAAGRYKCTATIAETVQLIGTEQRSEVFNCAYFVNNYGWMNGTSIIINGDMRANGDMSITGSTVNGRIYAARNDEVGADGEISFAPVAKTSGRTTTYTYPGMWSLENYWSSAGTSARPTSPTKSGGINWAGGFNAPANNISLTSASLSNVNDPGYAYLFEDAAPVAMPYISDLSDYREFAERLRTQGGANDPSTLKYNEIYVNSSGNLAFGDRKTISVCNYTQDDDYATPIANEMIASASAGPTGNIDAGDRGAVVLVGTKDKPIEINGPVVIASDVVIMGYVKGQGTIYSGRNIHIVGDLTYVDAPTWSHPDETPAETKTANASKDMLSLMAKGCVVVGDPTTYSWKNSIEPYITGSGTDNVSQHYHCDDNDSSIGYPVSTQLFDGNYTDQCGLTKYYDSAYCAQVTITKTTTTDRYGRSSTTTSSPSYGSTPVLKPLDQAYSASVRNLNNEKASNQTKTTTTVDRYGRTVETITSYEVLGNTKEPHYSSTKSKYSSYYANESARYYDSLIGDSLLNTVAQKGNAFVYGNNMAAGVAKINAVIYDNHGTFGQVGRSNTDFVLNGSLICRDEALVGASGIGKMIFNWDIRLKQDGAEGLSNDVLGLPLGVIPTSGTIAWRLVPDSMNPNYTGSN